MLNFLGFILLLFLLFVLGIAAFAGIIMRNLFGGIGHTTQDSARKHRTTSTGGNGSQTRNGQSSHRKKAEKKKTDGSRKKIFAKDEGTYVDFVEVKN